MNYNVFTTLVGTTSTELAFTLNAEILSGETIGEGWLPIYVGQGRVDGENMNCNIYSASRSAFSRWNGDPDPERLNIKAARKYRLDSGPTNYAYFGTYYTYNNITFTLSGTCTYSGGTAASGVTIKLHRAVLGSYDETIFATTGNSSGVFSVTWIDDTDTVYAVGYYSNSYVGRSTSVIASNTMDMIIRNPNTQSNFNLVLYDTSVTGRRIFLIS